MRLYIVSSPENISRLDAVLADLARLADPRGTSAAELDAIVARVPTVVWLSFSVHGNESPGFETAMQLYQLAASDEPATTSALRNSLRPRSSLCQRAFFRGWWRALDKMVLHAVLLGPTFRRSEGGS